MTGSGDLSLLFPMSKDDGFVFAATGAQYHALARRAARSLRAVMNDVQIDLFADEPVDDPIFDQIHMLQHKSKRPKIEAMRESRFKYTVYLDCDVISVADCTDIFALLRKFDYVGAQAQYGSGMVTLCEPKLTLPPGYRQINSGVVGVRKSQMTQELLQNWSKRMREESAHWDQPILRELLWQSDLRVWILPLEYNLMHIDYIPAMVSNMASPRVLHLSKLHHEPGFSADAESPYDLSEVLGKDALMRLYDLLGSDQTLKGRPTAREQVFHLLPRPSIRNRVKRYACRWLDRSGIRRPRV